MEFPETCHPDTIALYNYWLAKCGNRAMPARGNIDPVEMPRQLLAGICIVEVVSDERRYVYRLVGTGEVEVRGNDPTGKSVLEGFFGPSAEDALGCYDKVVKTRSPVLDPTPFTAPSGKWMADIEDSIPAWAKCPRVLVIAGKDWQGNPNGNLYYADSPESIRDLLGFNNSAFEMSARRIARATALDAELAKVREAAEAEYARCGRESESKRRDAMWHAMVPLCKRLEESPSTSPVAIAAKLDMAYASIEDVRQDLGDPPISYMGYVLRSLWEGLPADMQDALNPAASHEGRAHHLYDRAVRS